MKNLILIILPFFIFSCKKHEDKKVDFVVMPYDLKTNYLDSIAKKLVPNKHFKYWQYVSFRQQYGSGKETYSVLAQGGDTTFRKSINTKINPMKLNGLFEGGHPSFRSNYLVVIQKNKIEYLDTMEQLRDFIGNIDNLEEAILYAKTYGYSLGSKSVGRLYNFTDNIFTLRLVKYSDSYPETLFRLKGESVELSITKDGFIKSKSLGIYCEGADCLK